MNALWEVLDAESPDLRSETVVSATTQLLRSLHNDRRVRSTTDLRDVAAVCQAGSTDQDVRIFERRTSPATDRDVEVERARQPSSAGPGVHLELSDDEDFDDPLSQEVLRATLSLGTHVRRCSLPYRLHVYGRRTAILPLDCADNAAGAFVVQEPNAVRSLLELYRRVWRGSRPVPAHLHGSRQVPVEFTDVLAELLSGRSDEAAAMRLHIGLRTYRRRVQALMEALGVQNRFAAGAVAHERGYVALTGWNPRPAAPGS